MQKLEARNEGCRRKVHIDEIGCGWYFLESSVDVHSMFFRLLISWYGLHLSFGTPWSVRGDRIRGVFPEVNNAVLQESPAWQVCHPVACATRFDKNDRR